MQLAIESEGGGELVASGEWGGMAGKGWLLVV
jgi:hypothetical protein